jgi:hypothetical protein
MSEPIDGVADTGADVCEFAIGTRVRVRAGDGVDAPGTLIEDFGDTVGVPVDVGEIHIVDAARRWAVALDDGGLMFADDHHLTAQ